MTCCSFCLLNFQFVYRYIFTFNIFLTVSALFWKKNVCQFQFLNLDVCLSFESVCKLFKVSNLRLTRRSLEDVSTWNNERDDLSWHHETYINYKDVNIVLVLCFFHDSLLLDANMSKQDNHKTNQALFYELLFSFMWSGHLQLHVNIIPYGSFS